MPLLLLTRMLPITGTDAARPPRASFALRKSLSAGTLLVLFRLLDLLLELLLLHRHVR